VDGYAVCARIERASPHFVGAGNAVDGEARYGATPTTGPNEDLDHVELVGEPLDARFARWVAGLRDTWSQTTFYLFDPEGWR